MLDITFGSQGIATIPIGGQVESMQVASDASIIIAGAEYLNGTVYYSLFHYMPDGVQDAVWWNGSRLSAPLTQGIGFALGTNNTILVGGIDQSSKSALYRYNWDGTADKTFNSTGIRVLTGAGSAIFGLGSFVLTTFLIQPDGNIIVAGNYTPLGAGQNPKFAIGRITSSGTNDSSFTPLTFTLNSSETAGLQAMALQSDGKIIVVGNSCTSSLNNPACPLHLFRVLSTGALDTSFGSGTTGITTSAKSSTSFNILSDGSFLLGALAGPIGAILHFNSDGTLDSSYGTSGQIVTSQTNFALQPNGQPIYAIAGGASNLTISKLTTGGQLDPSFGVSGSVVTNTPFCLSPSTWVVQNDGKYLVAGAYTAIGPSGQTPSIAVARYLP